MRRELPSLVKGKDKNNESPRSDSLALASFYLLDLYTSNV